jgi:hypothetical protein
MHLTNNTAEGDSTLVAAEESEAAGATDKSQERYLSMASLETAAAAGASLFSRRRASPEMEKAFCRWLAENAYALEDGGSGDVLSLFEALYATSQKVS